MENSELGQIGEEYAVFHLQKLGYLIIERNWRIHRFEIDIIAQIGNTLIITEVKTRDTDFWGDPSDFLSKRQQKNLIEAADYYIKEVFPCKEDPEIRFDVISVIIKEGEMKTLEHYEDAFYPTL